MAASVIYFLRTLNPDGSERRVFEAKTVKALASLIDETPLAAPSTSRIS